MKIRKKCGEAKPLDQFYKAEGTRDGVRGECIDCAKVVRRQWYEANKDKAVEAARRWQQRNPERTAAYREEYRNRPERKRAMRDRHYRMTYGISADDFDALLAGQGGVCAICDVPDPAHLDHDHRTGEIRGILCVNCNQGLGKFGDDLAVLERAVAYLRGR